MRTNKNIFIFIFLLFLTAFINNSIYAQGNPIQTGTDITFVKDMKLTDVTIDISKIKNPSISIRNQKFGNNKINSEVYYKNITPADKDKSPISNQGQCFTFLYEDAAILSDGTRANLVLSYSDINIYISKYQAFESSNSDGTAKPSGTVIVADGNNMKAGTTNSGEGTTWYAGVEETVTAYVVDKNNNRVTEGNMFFWLHRINSSRGATNFNKDTGKINFNSANNNYNRISEDYKDKHGWNEQVILTKDFLTDNIYYPISYDGDNYKAAVINGTNPGQEYISSVTNPIQNNQVLICGQVGGNDNSSHYRNGFATATNAAFGPSIIYRTGTGYNNGSQNINNQIWPTDIAYTITSSSGNGGTIKTGKDGGSGNTLDLDGGEYSGPDIPKSMFISEEYAGEGPRMYSVPYGKNVKYTMTPSDGYMIDKLYINGDENTNYQHEEDENGKIKSYTYTFQGNIRDHQTIHVTWKHAPINIEFEKIWVDEENKHKLRPSSITIQLKADGNNEGDPVTVNSNTWKHTFEDLDGDKEYTIAEDPIPTGYHPSYGNLTPKAGDPYTFTYTITNTLETIDLEFQKIWNDNDNEKGLRPENIKIKLQANNEDYDGKVITVNETDNWNYTFTGLPKYGKNDQNADYEIDYEIIELEDENSPLYEITKEKTPDKTTGNISYELKNNLTPQSVTLPPVLKVILPFPPEKKTEYQFEIQPHEDTPDAPLPDPSAVSIYSDAEQKSAPFGKIDFYKSGEYKYKLTETSESSEYTKDNTVYTITVTVPKPGNGSPSPSVTYEKNGDPQETLDAFTFINRYPSSTRGPVVLKMIEPAGRKTTDTFQFKLTGYDGALMPEGSVGNTKIIELSGIGSKSFLGVSFKNPGTYEYLIEEVCPSDPAYECDTTKYNVTLVIDEDLKITRKVKKNGIEVTDPKDPVNEEQDIYTFVNKYKDDPSADVPPVIKAIHGPLPDPIQTYTFEISAVTPDAPMPEHHTLEIRSDETEDNKKISNPSARSPFLKKENLPIRSKKRSAGPQTAKMNIRWYGQSKTGKYP